MTTNLNWTNQHVYPDLIIADFFEGRHGKPDVIEVLEGTRESFGEVLDEGEDPLHLHAVFLVTGLTIVQLPGFGFSGKAKLQVFYKTQVLSWLNVRYMYLYVAILIV